MAIMNGPPALTSQAAPSINSEEPSQIPANSTIVRVDKRLFFFVMS